MAAVVIMACNRADYLERTINSVLKYVSLQPIFFTLLLFYAIIIQQFICIFQISKAHFFKISFICIAGIFYVYTSRCAVLRNLLWSLIQMIYKCICKCKYNTQLIVIAFIIQDGSNSDVKSKALSYNELSHMQVYTFTCMCCT